MDIFGRQASAVTLLGADVDDCLSLASLGRGEGSDCVVEVCGGSNVCLESSVAYALDDFGELAGDGFDDEVDGSAVDGAR